jgi:hypothetical protein
MNQSPFSVPLVGALDPFLTKTVKLFSVPDHSERNATLPSVETIPVVPEPPMSICPSANTE